MNPSPGDRSPGTELEEGRHEPLDVVPGEDLEPFAVGKKRKNKVRAVLLWTKV